MAQEGRQGDEARQLAQDGGFGFVFYNIVKDCEETLVNVNDRQAYIYMQTFW